MIGSMASHRGPDGGGGARTGDAVTTPLDGLSLATLTDRVASTDPAPGAGPSLAWTCSLAAALVEMGVSAITLPKDGRDVAAVERRRERAAALRAAALDLADEDMAAYTAVLEVLRRRAEPGHGGRLRAALSAAADPPLAIVEVASES